MKLCQCYLKSTVSANLPSFISETYPASESTYQELPLNALFMPLSGADSEIFERGGPEAIIYKILEKGGPKYVKMAFEYLFQLFSYNFFCKYSTKRGGPGPLGPSPKSATVCYIQTGLI